MHLVKTILTAGLLLSASAQAHNVLEFPQPENNPEEFYAVTEIPTGGIIKYETDAKTGFIVADRFQWPGMATRWTWCFIPARRWPRAR